MVIGCDSKSISVLSSFGLISEAASQSISICLCYYLWSSSLLVACYFRVLGGLNKSSGWLAVSATMSSLFGI